ncbi:MAG: carbon-nitrogen hydrolase family protein [Deltaproteobacteria bacterium]|nr:carbon-nitrogen hydrolase family protein [Deltaproteobacteria bacterium]
MTVRAVALVQVDVKRQWRLQSMLGHLAVAKDLGADLAVFPEAFPFWQSRTRALRMEDATDRLAALACPPDLAFVAGGYVLDKEDQLRNAAFLVSSGRRVRHYFKRKAWRGGTGGERRPGPYGIHEGTEAVVFRWRGGSCLPLICSDVFGQSAGDQAAHEQWLRRELAPFREEAPDLVVVPSYPKAPTGKRWCAMLRLAAAVLDRPVAFCSVAGHDESGFGGGGSAVYFPDGTRSPAPPPRTSGVFVIELPQRA